MNTTTNTTNTTTIEPMMACDICAKMRPDHAMLAIFVGPFLIEHDICGPCHYKYRHLSTTTDTRFDTLPEEVK